MNGSKVIYQTLAVNKSLTIKIPIALAAHAVWQRTLVNKYQTNQVIRALDTWLVLKAEAPGSLIQFWNGQKKELLQLCKVSETIFRHRIRLLSDMGLVKVTKNIELCSWDHLANTFEIDIKDQFTIQYNIDDKQKVAQWLIATEMRDNQFRQAYKILQKVNKNPYYKTAIIAEMIRAGADRSQIDNPDYFLSWLKIIYVEDFVKASAIHDLLIEIRPDTNRGVKATAAAWKAKHATTVSYWKNKLHQSGIIDIGKLQILSNSRVRNSKCRVLWLPKQQQTLLCLCDQITILTPWLYPDLKFLSAA